MDKQTQKIIDLIAQTDLDQTIKDIFIRDLQNEGLTDFLREQIKAYCLQGLKEIEPHLEEAEKILAEKQHQNPSA